MTAYEYKPYKAATPELQAEHDAQASEVRQRAARRRAILERAAGVTDDTIALEFGA